MMEELLNDTLLGNPVRDWAVALGLTLGLFIGFWQACRWLARRGIEYAYPTQTVFLEPSRPST